MSYIEEVIEEYSDLVYHLAMIKMGNRATADDIYQEVFLKYMKYKDHITNKEHEKAWFIRTTTTTCKAAFLNSWRKRTVPMNYDIAFQTKESSALFYHVMELPEKYRTVLYLYYYEGYLIKDIARYQKRKETTIKTQLKRGRELLKASLKGEDPFENL